jgi:hypothetical protein
MAAPGSSTDSEEEVMDPANTTAWESWALNANVPWAAGRVGSSGQDASRVPVPDFIRHGLGGKVRATEKFKVTATRPGGNPTQPAEQVPSPV